MGLAQIKMPQLGESVTEGTVDKWLKHEGDFVKGGEPIVEVVTDKVNAEIPSPFEGKLVKIAVSEGETVLVGAMLAQIEVAPAPGAAAAATPARAAKRAPARRPGALGSRYRPAERVRRRRACPPFTRRAQARGRKRNRRCVAARLRHGRAGHSRRGHGGRGRRQAREPGCCVGTGPARRAGGSSARRARAAPGGR